jgi:peptide/nickel transport system permease protein
MRFILQRIAFYLVALWVAITVNFFIPRLMPGNPAQALLAKFPNIQPSAYKALVAELGIGHGGSLIGQYFTYLGDLFQGNLGVSASQFPSSVTSLIIAALPWTLVLVGVATVISFIVGTLLGMLAAWRRGGWFERLLPGFAFFQAIPYFFFALIVVYVLSITLHLFPAGQGYNGAAGIRPGFSAAFLQSATIHSFLPALTIVLATLFGWMLQMRNVMMTTIGEEYVLAGQAKGLSDRRVMTTYAGRNAILPSISGFALALGFVISGALVMELVFSYPGIGFLLFNAVQSTDYATMQGIFLVISITVIAANFLADLVYVMADPRARTRTEA